MNEVNRLGEQVERYLLTKQNPHTERWYAKYLRPMAAFIGIEREVGGFTRRDGELVSMSTERIDLKLGTAWVNGKRGWRKIFLGEACIEAIFVYLCERKDVKNEALWLIARHNALSADNAGQKADSGTPFPLQRGAQNREIPWPKDKASPCRPSRGLAAPGRWPSGRDGHRDVLAARINRA